MFSSLNSFLILYLLIYINYSNNLRVIYYNNTILINLPNNNTYLKQLLLYIIIPLNYINKALDIYLLALI